MGIENSMFHILVQIFASKLAQAWPFGAHDCTQEPKHIPYALKKCDFLVCTIAHAYLVFNLSRAVGNKKRFIIFIYSSQL